MRETRQNRNVIVTGGSRGLGRAIALEFGRAGDRVVVNWQSDESSAAAVIDEIVQSGGQAFPFKADVRNAAEVNALFAETAARWGSIEVLVNNAGITSDRLLIKMGEPEWDAVLDTNLKGPFNTIRAMSGLMSGARRGHIINIASIVGLQGREGQANYASAKAALIGLTKACARELGSYNIQVNAVLPGYLPTLMGQQVPPAVVERVVKENALNRISDPTEVARFIFHLSLMKNVSGQVFNLDSRII